MRRAVLPQIGDRDIAALTHEPVQAALNHMADMPLLIGIKKQFTRIGYGESALKTARTYMRAVFEFAIEENLITRNPARKLILPGNAETVRAVPFDGRSPQVARCRERARTSDALAFPGRRVAASRIVCPPD
jgi:site-specific recombinase XerD